MDFLLESWGHAWRILLEAAPYIWLGLLAAGALHVWIPRDWVMRRLGGRNHGAVLKAALLGVPLPLCSCGVIPAAVGLRRQGAGRGATLSFLISTPETSVDSLALTYALFGPVWTVLRPVAAVFVAVLTGLAANLLPDPQPAAPPESENCVVCNKPADHKHTHTARLRRAWTFVFRELLPDIGGWLLLGVAVSGVLLALLPSDFLPSLPGGPATQMLLALLVGAPLYICASASTPLAAALLMKGLAPGAALVLLLAGPATNLASAFVVSRQLGRQATAVYFGGVAAGSLIAGGIVQALPPTWRLTEVALEPKGLPDWLAFALAGALLLAVILPWLQRKPLSGSDAATPADR